MAVARNANLKMERNALANQQSGSHATAYRNRYGLVQAESALNQICQKLITTWVLIICVATTIHA